MAAWLYIVWVSVELLLVIAAGALWVASPDTLTLNLSLSVFTLFLGILLAYPRRVDFVTWLKSRQFRSALTQIAGFFLVAGSVALVNHLGWKFPVKWDLTEKKLNTLSDQTKKVLAALPEDVSVTFFAKREDWAQGMAILSLYRDAHPTLKLEAVDIEGAPQKARAEGVVENGTVILKHKENRVVFLIKDELSVTNAFLKLARPRRIKVYFTIGHGESLCSMKTEGGISAFCDHLVGQLYDVNTLDLQRAKEIPADAELVIVWGPTTGMLPVETQRLQRWLERGGSLLALLSPGFLQDTSTELRQLLRNWGLVVNNDLVIDRLSTLENNEATIPIVTKYEPNHPTTRNFTARTLFPLSSSVEMIAPIYAGVATQTLAYTSPFPGSWGERDLAGIAKGKAEYNDKVDLKGPVALAAVAERVTDKAREKDTRVAAIGNDAFARNAYQAQTANMNLLLNVVGWLAHDEGLLSLSRPNLAQDPIVLSAIHLHVVFYLVVVTLPLLALIGAVLVYRRRRKL